MTLLLTIALAAGLASTGCRHSNNSELLESELRARDIQYREVLDELKRSEFEKSALQREVESLRVGQKFTPEAAAHTFGLKRLTLGRGTSGIDNDGMPGDDALQVIVEPRDNDDHIIKAPSTLQISALEISPQGTKSVLSTWDIGPEQMRQSWKQGLFSTGYIFVLPWKSWPQTDNLRVVARLVLTDGRVFEADRDIRVRLPVGVQPCPLPLPAPSEVPLPLQESAVRSSSAKTPLQQTSWQPAAWQPAPLSNVVNLGRPEPVEPPVPMNPIGLMNELPDPFADPFAVWGPPE